MEILGSLIFSAFLLVCALGLMVWHVSSWRAAQQRELEPAEREYCRRQYRGRMQTSILLAIIAASLPVGVWIMNQWPKAGVLFWGLVLLMLAWLAVLALADIWATKFYYGRLRDKYQLEQTRLKAELRRLQAARSNGKSNGNGTHHGRDPEVQGPGPETKS